MNNFLNWLDNLLFSSGIEITNIPYLRLLILVGSLIIISIICFYITKYLVIHTIYKFIKRTRIQWDDILVERKSLDNLAHLIPALLVKACIPLIFIDFKQIIPFLSTLADIYIIIAIMILIISLLKASEVSISTSPIFTNKPIGSYFQLVRIIIYIIVAILIVSFVIGKSPFYLLSAFGALSAIVLLIFKDTILGFVASVQISSNDIIRVGDWIEIPKFNADGEVIAINLNTVKISNWDKTTTTVPTYYFISDSFKNWRSMKQSGVRRINRPIYFNIRSIKFIDSTLKKRLSANKLIHNFLLEKNIEINNNNHDFNVLNTNQQLTNIGIFKQYMEYYLKNSTSIRQDMTLMIRQLTITEKGMPLEIYCFTDKTEWIDYEEVISDIFNYILATAPYFDLEIFQIPSGEDIVKGMQACTQKH